MPLKINKMFIFSYLTGQLQISLFDILKFIAIDLFRMHPQRTGIILHILVAILLLDARVTGEQFRFMTYDWSKANWLRSRECFLKILKILGTHWNCIIFQPNQSLKPNLPINDKMLNCYNRC